MIYSNLFINSKNWNHLTNSLNTGKLAHAILLHGPPGSGKEGHAIEFAALLNCSLNKENKSCGNCSSCYKMKSLQHENLKFVLPLPRGKIKSRSDHTSKAFDSLLLNEYLDKIKKKSLNPYYPIQLSNAKTILINSIRDIKQEVILSTVNNDWKIFIIFQAEKLCFPNTEAANSLLKILEEPPQKTLFLLVSSHINSIIDTIKSRCQSIYFPPISNKIIYNYLIEYGLDEEKAIINSLISGGNVRLAQELRDKSSDLMEKFHLLLNSCFSSNPKNWINFIDIASQLKNKNLTQLEQLFNCALLFFRDLLYYSVSRKNNKIVFKNHLNKITKLTNFYSQANWNHCIQVIENTFTYISYNGYLPIQITCMIFEIQKSLKGEIYESFKLHDWIDL